MKLPDWISLSVDNALSRFPHKRLVLGFLVAGSFLSASAQSVFAPGPAPAPPQPAAASTPTTSATNEGLATPVTAPFQWGVLGFRPHFFYRYSYGDGIQTQPGLQRTSSVQTVAPGMLVDIGTHWTADYTPTWTFYSNRAFSDNVAHSADLTGVASFTDGNLNFVQRYAKSDNPLIETGQQTRQETATTALTVNYALTQKTRLEASIDQDLRYVSGAPNSYEWSTQEWLHYQFSNRIDTAVGFGFGYVNVEPGTDMTYTRPQVRVGWRPTEKLSFDVHGGAEQREFRQSNAGSLNNPVYGASVQYRPIDVTTISIQGDRGVTASYFANQVTENTTWSANLNQRLLEVLHLSASVSRGKSNYVATIAGLATNRDDVSTSYVVRLGTSFLHHGTIGVVYQHVRNSSNASGFSFSSDQTGVEVGYSY